MELKICECGAEYTTGYCGYCSEACYIRHNTKVCPQCGKEFFSIDKRQKYCSDECRYAAIKKKNAAHERAKREAKGKKIYIRICPQCGKEFQTDRANKKYCCEECKYRAAYSKLTPRAKKPHPTLTCPQCGREFIQMKFSQKYCSMKCHKDAEKKTLTVKVCKTCGKEFLPKAFNQVYCCEDCRKKTEYKKHLLKKRLCDYCGKEFQPRSNDQKYCSAECRRSAARKNKKPGKLAKCRVCGKEFVTYGNGMYCSDKRARKGKESPVRKHGYGMTQREYEAKVRRDRKALKNAIKEANAAGMSYGMYMALRGN